MIWVGAFMWAALIFGAGFTVGFWFHAAIVNEVWRKKL